MAHTLAGQSRQPVAAVKQRREASYAMHLFRGRIPDLLEIKNASLCAATCRNRQTGAASPRHVFGDHFPTMAILERLL